MSSFQILLQQRASIPIQRTKQYQHEFNTTRNGEGRDGPTNPKMMTDNNHGLHPRQPPQQMMISSSHTKANKKMVLGKKHQHRLQQQQLQQRQQQPPRYFLRQLNLPKNKSKDDEHADDVDDEHRDDDEGDTTRTEPPNNASQFQATPGSAPHKVVRDVPPFREDIEAIDTYDHELQEEETRVDDLIGADDAKERDGRTDSATDIPSVVASSSSAAAVGGAVDVIVEFLKETTIGSTPTTKMTEMSCPPTNSVAHHDRYSSRPSSSSMVTVLVQNVTDAFWKCSSTINAADIEVEVDETKHELDQELTLPKVKVGTHTNRLRIDTDTAPSTTNNDDTHQTITDEDDKLSISVDGSILPRSTADDNEDRGRQEHTNSGKPHGHDPVDEFDFDDYEALTLDSTVEEDEDDEAPGMGTDDGSCSGIGIIIGTSHHDMTITTPFYPTLEQNNISPMARYRRRASQ